MTSPPPQLFLRALAAGEVPAFLAGEPPYFVPARNDNEEPQNFDAAFDTAVLPTWRASRDPRIPAALEQALLQLLRAPADVNRALYVAENWIRCHAYRAWKQRTGPAPAPGEELFDLDLAPAAAALKALMASNKDALRRDQRWAGAAWNSPDGLWTPLVRTALFVRDKWGGPDFVPANP